MGCGEGVMVEVEEKAFRQEVGLPEASIPLRDCHNEEVEIDMVGKVA